MNWLPSAFPEFRRFNLAAGLFAGFCRLAASVAKPAAMALALLLGGQIAYSQTVSVTTASGLQSAVNNANSSGGNVTIRLADGVYTLNDTLYVNASNVTITSQSGVRENVVIQGDAMSSSARVGNLIRVAGSNFKLSAVTLQRTGWHLIQVAGEENADNPQIRDCILRDAYEQLVKVTGTAANANTRSDGGVIENCLFEYTAGIGPQYYIGGIDAHGARDWAIRGNTFRNIISPNTTVAEYAVHFWNGSQDNLVEKNLIVNCDRGIGFGLGDQGNTGGTIRNNMIYHAANKGQFADVGIGLQNSPGSSVYGNTIYMEHSYPSAIEYRFAGTTGVTIVNNLMNKSLSQIQGATGTTGSNLTNAQAGWFVSAATGDLHLASAVTSVVDRGQAVADLTEDFDGDVRPGGSSNDIGADEYMANVKRPRPPTGLVVQ